MTLSKMPFNKKISSYFSCLFLLGLLAGCKASEPTPLPALRSVPTTFQASSDSTSLADLSWKEFFRDPFLVNLIDSALQHNPDVLSAVQQVEIARANTLLSRGALLPQVTAIGAAGVEKFGDYTMTGVGNFDTNLSPNINENQKVSQPLVPDYFLGLRSAWEVDLWGKLRKAKKAAFTRLMASEKGKQLVTTALISEVAHQYYYLLALDREKMILENNIKLQQTALEMVKVQKEAGRATQLAVQQFEAQLLNTRGLKAEKEREIQAVEGQLNQLLGRYPQPIVRSQTLDAQELPAQMKAGVPSDLLRRRPDIQQAELELQAAQADVAAARAAFLPSLMLSPYVGFNSFNASLLFKPASVAYGIIGGLSAPLLNRSGIKADFRRADAAKIQAYHAYQKSILTGVREVMTNLREIENYQQASALKEQEVKVLQNAVSTSNDLFTSGYASYLEVITAQRGVLEAELKLAATKRTVLQSTVNLYRALGGCWK